MPATATRIAFLLASEWLWQKDPLSISAIEGTGGNGSAAYCKFLTSPKHEMIARVSWGQDTHYAGWF